MNRPPENDLSAAEQRLLALLLLLRTEDGRQPPALVTAVMRTVRWQRALRDVMSAIAGLLAAVADGVLVVAGLRRRASRIGR